MRWIRLTPSFIRQLIRQLIRPLIQLFCRLLLLGLISESVYAACDVRPVTQFPAPQFKNVNEAPPTNKQRQATIERWWQSSCSDYRQMDLPGRRSSNLICRIPGDSAQTIVIGAHFDKVQKGKGVADNWSGIVILDALVQTFQSTKHTFSLEFVAFAAEEPGLFGARAYLQQQDLPIQAMVNLDTIGLQRLIIGGESDPALACQALNIAEALGVETRVKSWHKITGDWERFARAGIPVLSMHSVDRSTVKQIHSRRDKAGNVDLGLLAEAYQVAANVLAQIANSNKERGAGLDTDER